jgi:hypothetical protein
MIETNRNVTGSTLSRISTGLQEWRTPLLDLELWCLLLIALLLALAPKN